MKFAYKTVVTTSILLVCLPTVQAEPFTTSANVALTSDYVYRGISQTDEGLAIQGGFDINHESGFYIGTWGSNVNFLEDDSVAPEDRANVEIDVYVGLNGDLTEELNYDVKIGQYMYPDGASSDSDMTEFNITLTYTMPQDTELGLQYDYSPDFGGSSGNSHHYLLSINHTLPTGLGFGAYIAQQTIDDADDYSYYGASIFFPIVNLDASISYSNTDLESGEDIGADDRVFFTLSKSF